MTATPLAAPILTDGRLRLRPLNPVDRDALFAAVDESRETVGRWMSWLKPDYSVKDAEEWIAHSEQNWASDTGERPFGVFDAASGEFLGNSGLNQFNRIHHFANLGYWIRTSRMRMGVASAAVKLVARYGFESLGLARIEIVAQVPNIASRRVAEKAGGRLDGIARSRLAHGDRHFDAAVYSLLPSAFLPREWLWRTQCPTKTVKRIRSRWGRSFLDQLLPAQRDSPDGRARPRNCSLARTVRAIVDRRISEAHHSRRT